jgi:hypothetical protein
MRVDFSDVGTRAELGHNVDWWQYQGDDLGRYRDVDRQHDTQPEREAERNRQDVGAKQSAFQPGQPKHTRQPPPAGQIELAFLRADRYRRHDWHPGLDGRGDVSRATTEVDRVFLRSTALELRLTPALTPDWATVDHDIVTNPVASLDAIFNNAPLAASDVTLPTELAIGDTVLSLLLPQQLGSPLNDTVFDPNTGIIAGFLNARDDLATAVLTANDDFPS